MRTTLTIDDDVYRAAVSRSRRSGRRLGQVVSEMLRESLQSQGSVRIKRVPGKRFVTLEVPAGTPPVDLETIQRLLDEEGAF